MINICWFNLLCETGYWFNKMQELKKDAGIEINKEKDNGMG